MRKCVDKLIHLLRARDNLIFVNTYEDNEFIKELCSAAREVYGEKNAFLGAPRIYLYTRPDGLYELDPMNPMKMDSDKKVDSVKNHLQALEYLEGIQNGGGVNKPSIMEMAGKSSSKTNHKEVSRETVLVMKDMHLFFSDKDFIVKLRNMKGEYGDKKLYCPIIITAPVMEFPPELEKIFTVFNFPLMDKEEITKMIYPLIREVEKDKTKDELDAVISSLAAACVGLTEREIRRALAHSLAKNNKKCVSLEDIYNEKLAIIKKTNALDYCEPKHGINDLGGCANFKNWIYKVKEMLTPEAHEFGIPQPKGAMLVGVPGTSKTVSAEILASYLNVPLLSLDMAKVMGSLVGQSERQIANALRIAQAAAPCVLLIDEAEKGFGGFQSSAQADAGTLSRTMGQLLAFLAKEDTNVITIMTSNDVNSLPPELTRTGRLDAQWFFDLPNKEERREIIDIYLNYFNLNVCSEDKDFIVAESENFTGAEIRGAVKEMLVASYCRQMKSGNKPSKKLNREDITEGLNSIITVYKSSKEKIDQFRAFAKDRYLNASGKVDAKKKEPEKGSTFFSLIPKHKA